jgi:hypothetical protein
VLCQWALPQNRTFEYPTIGNNKMAYEESCEVGPRVGQAGTALWWLNSEICLKTKYHTLMAKLHYQKSRVVRVTRVTMVTTNGKR